MDVLRRRRRRPSTSRVESECRRILPGLSRPLCVVATSEWPNRDRLTASQFVAEVDRAKILSERGERRAFLSVVSDAHLVPLPEQRRVFKSCF
jgi:hypothetical protein